MNRLLTPAYIILFIDVHCNSKEVFFIEKDLLEILWSDNKLIGKSTYEHKLDEKLWSKSEVQSQTNIRQQVMGNASSSSSSSNNDNKNSTQTSQKQSVPSKDQFVGCIVGQCIG